MLDATHLDRSPYWLPSGPTWKHLPHLQIFPALHIYFSTHWCLLKCDSWLLELSSQTTRPWVYLLLLNSNIKYIWYLGMLRLFDNRIVSLRDKFWEHAFSTVLYLCSTVMLRVLGLREGRWRIGKKVRHFLPSKEFMVLREKLTHTNTYRKW